MLPKVSIITPTLNQSKYLERTILSVLNQKYRNIEYIIVDGGSDDETLDIIKKYNDKISKWYSEKDLGQSHAINKGFKASTGDILCWLNSDDILQPYAVSIAVMYLQNNQQIGLVYGNRIVIDEYDQALYTVELPSFNKFLFKFNNKLPQETAFFKKELFFNTNGLSQKLHYAMDLEFWLKSLKNNKFKHIPFYLGCWRRHSDSKSYEGFKCNKNGYYEVKMIKKQQLGFVFRIEFFQKIVAKFDVLRLFFQKYSKKNKKEYKTIIDFISAINKN